MDLRRKIERRQETEREVLWLYCPQFLSTISLVYSLSYFKIFQFQKLFNIFVKNSSDCYFYFSRRLSKADQILFDYFQRKINLNFFYAILAVFNAETNVIAEGATKYRGLFFVHLKKSLWLLLFFMVKLFCCQPRLRGNPQFGDTKLFLDFLENSTDFK